MLSKYEENLVKINEKMINLANIVYDGEKLIYDGFKDKDDKKLDDAKAVIRGCGVKANEIDQEIIKILALFGPEATQLREMIAYLKITNELVNTASTIKSYIKNNKALFASEFDLGELYGSILALHQSAMGAVKYMVEIMNVNQNEEQIRALYRSIKVEESKGDDLYSIVQKDIAEMMCHIDVDPLDYMTILKIARKLEHVSDHAVNIGRLVLFIKVGGDLETY